MAKIDQIAQSFIGAAKKNPGQKHEICRQAAYAFMNAAQNPQNAGAAKPLTEMGLAFARAAQNDRPPVIEDFEDLLHETAASYEAAGRWGDDPMDLVAMRREIHDDRTVLAPGETFITPPSFNKDVTLGRTTKIKWNPTDDEIKNGIQQSQTVAFWQGIKKEAQAATIDTNLTNLYSIEGVPGDINANLRPYTDVEFGSDGNKTKIRFDLRMGQRLTVVGNYISVLVGMGPPKLTVPATNSFAISAGASIGMFAAPSLAPLILTEFVDNLAKDDHTQSLPIPIKAVLVLPPQTDLLFGETLRIDYYDLGQTFISSTFYQQGYTSQSPMVIPADAAFFQVVNPATNGGTRSFRVPFQLSV